MPVMTMRCAYRPARVGFLLAEGDLSQVVAAAQLSSLIWGGRESVMLATTDADVDQLIRAARVDLLHDLTVTGAGDPIVARQPFLQTRLLSTFPASFATSVLGEGVGLVDMRPVLEEIGRAVATDSRAAITMEWPDDHPFRALFESHYGSYPNDERGRMFNAYFRGQTRATPRTVEEFVVAEGERPEFPLARTMRHLQPDYRPYELRTGIYVGDPASARDLRLYWNLRAAGVSALFWPISGLDDLPPAWRDSLTRLVDDRRTTTGTVEVWMDSENRAPDERFQAAFAAIGQPHALYGFSLEEWFEPTFHPPLFRTAPAEVLATVDNERETAQITFALPRDPFEPSAAGRMQTWVISILPLVEREIEGSTLTPPFVPDENPWFGENIAPISDVRVELGGIGIFTRRGDRHVSLRSLSEQAILTRLLARAGVTSQRSPAGQIAHHALRQLGGYFGLAPFRYPGVRQLLADNEGRRGLPPQTAQQRIKHAPPRADGRSPNEQRVWELLLHLGLFRPVCEIQCPSCRTRTGFEPENLSNNQTCPRCGTTYPLGPNLRTAAWKFRRSGFYEEEGAGGIVPVLLTLGALRETGLFDTHLAETSHELRWTSATGDRQCETDVLLATRNPPVQIVVGECKGADHITEDDLKNLAEVAALIRDSNIECFIAMATTREAFSDDEVARFKSFRDSVRTEPSSTHDGMQREPLILLTRTELEEIGRFGLSIGEPHLPFPHPGEFFELAANSAATYLS
jgi:hypothetical protein